MTPHQAQQPRDAEWQKRADRMNGTDGSYSVAQHLTPEEAAKVKGIQTASQGTALDKSTQRPQ